MGDDASQLIFTLHRFKQTAVDKNMTRRTGKSVIDVLLHDIKMVRKWLSRNNRENFFANLIYIPHN